MGQCFTPHDTGVAVCLAPQESQAFKSMRSRKIYEWFLSKAQAEPEYQANFKEVFPPTGDVTHLNMALAIAEMKCGVAPKTIWQVTPATLSDYPHSHEPRSKHHHRPAADAKNQRLGIGDR